MSLVAAPHQVTKGCIVVYPDGFVFRRDCCFAGPTSGWVEIYLGHYPRYCTKIRMAANCKKRIFCGYYGLYSVFIHENDKDVPVPAIFIVFFFSYYRIVNNFHNRAACDGACAVFSSEPPRFESPVGKSHFYSSMVNWY